MIKYSYLYMLAGLLVVSFFIGKSPVIKFVAIDNYFTNLSFTLFYFFSSIFILLFFLYQKKFIIKKEALLLPGVLILLSFSLIHSLDKEEALFFYFAIFLLAIILTLLATMDHIRYKIFIEYFVKFKVFLSLLIIVLALTKLMLLGIESFENNRLSIFGGPNIFIRFVFFLVIISMIFIENKFIKLISIFILSYTLFLSGSKAAFVILIIYLFIENKKHSFFILVFILLLWQTVNLDILMNLIENKTILRTLVVSDANNMSGSTTGRLDNFIYTWDNFQSNPLFGIGLSSYPVLNNFMQPHPHNIILELINYGLIYAFTFICSIFYLFYKSKILQRREDKYEETMRQTSLYFTIFIMFSGDLFYSKDFYLSLFLFYILIEKGKKQYVP